MRTTLLAIGLLLGLMLSCAVSLFVGLLLGQRSAEHRQFLDERELIGPVLASDPAFADIQIHENAGGGVFLVGVVKSAEDLERLRGKLGRCLLKTNRDVKLSGVDVERR
jgi:hypothetical protein